MLVVELSDRAAGGRLVGEMRTAQRCRAWAQPAMSVPGALAVTAVIVARELPLARGQRWAASEDLSTPRMKRRPGESPLRVDVITRRSPGLWPGPGIDTSRADPHALLNQFSDRAAPTRTSFEKGLA
ncbi:hypothetical protein FHG89_24080 [Micromonospora orduensis]|uniref:Uncharacterized protein n=1 Tax=Micromonospora orduensis TaxID=1420891 RepID=A0A5C4QIT6_9ACTN|nr:hypothetical protein [Micromonospora orduensis]TNH24964.1 hypothetical protein FHG89_24080 [Micromonospora orduensis]